MLKHADGDWQKRKTAANRDAAQTVHAQNYWAARGLWPIDDNQVRPPPRLLNVDGMNFRAHGYVPEVNAFIVLGCPYSERTVVAVAGSRFNPFYAGCSKHSVLLRGCPDTVFYLNEADDFAFLHELLAAVSSSAAGTPPNFRLQLPGEISSSSIFEALFDVGSFAENLALHPEKLADVLKTVALGDIERAVAIAVSEFYAEFRAFCSTNGMCTFNELFLGFGSGSERLKGIPLASLRSMKHLLIDEFQDISPLIVQFVRGLHEELYERTNYQEHPTLLAVGDDWQSIYGWRGSAPHFFLRFASLFDGAAKETLQLTDNFRSSQNIVDAAAYPISATSPRHRLEKKCFAKNPSVATAPLPVLLLEEDVQPVLTDILTLLMKDLGREESVLVLSRSRSSDAEARRKASKWKSDSRLQCMTIHKSKGLEATYVLVLGDTNYGNRNPLRNAMYRQAGFEQSYDEAQADEAKRLAYVAITRAERMCVWTGVPKDDGAMQTVVEGTVAQRVDVGQLRRSLEGVGVKRIEFASRPA